MLRALALLALLPVLAIADDHRSVIRLDRGGSAVAIQDGWAVSAAHCVTGLPNSSMIEATAPGGKRLKLYLVAQDPAADLALFTCNGEIERAKIEYAMPVGGTVEAAGYPSGTKTLAEKRLGNVRERDGKWLAHVEKGVAWEGDSGGGVFIDGVLCGIVQRYEPVNSGTPGVPSTKWLYCCTHSTLIDFLRRHHAYQPAPDPVRELRPAGRRPERRSGGAAAKTDGSAGYRGTKAAATR